MTEENREFAKNQILRLAMLVNFPAKAPPAMADLIDALMTATDEPMAKTVIDAFLDGATSDTRCPMASEIKSACLALVRAGMEWLGDPDCQNGCKGSGEIFTQRGDYTASRPCECLAWRIPPVYPKGKPFDVSGAVSKVRVQ